VQVGRFQSVVFALGVTGGIVREHGQSSLVSSLEKILEIATQALLIPGFLTSFPSARFDVHLRQAFARSLVDIEENRLQG
jgi:hypothetical protein